MASINDFMKFKVRPVAPCRELDRALDRRRMTETFCSFHRLQSNYRKVSNVLLQANNALTSTFQKIANSMQDAEREQEERISALEILANLARQPDAGPKDDAL